MSLYFFDIQFGDAPTSIDEEGQSHPDVDAARVEAGLMLTGLAREMFQSGKVVSSITIRVRDELGEVICAKLEIQMRRLN
jgi:hypothetical protein